MRLDKFLKVSRLIKRRTVANEACDAEKVIVNGKAARASYEVKTGDIIEILIGKPLKVRVLDVKEFTKKVRDILSFVPYAEILFISALTGQRTMKIFEHLERVIQNHAMRIQTGVLNEILMEAVAMQQPPSDKGKRLKLFYITQVSTKPPTFVLFVNNKELMHFSYQRYIENRIRDTFGFAGTPIRIFIRERKEKE